MAAVAGAAVQLRPAGAAPASSRAAPWAMTARGGRVAPFAAGLALLAGLALYGLTCAPGVQGGDSGEFQFVAYILGIPHPPGYPLYALVGRLWTLILPVGEVAYRMNLLSAVAAAATLAGVAWASATVFGPGTVGVSAAAVAAGWLAVAPTWWGQATIASVRPGTGLFLAATLAALASFAATRRPAALYLAAALYGLGLTHHLSLYTLAPALIAFVLLVEPRVLTRPAVLGRALAAGALPLLVYLYLPIRSALGTPFDASHPTTLRAFFDLVSARGFAGDMLAFDPLAPERLELGRQILLTNFGPLGLALAMAGALATALARPRWLALTAGVAAINLAISLSYRAPVIADYLIPTYLILALWIGGLVAAPALLLRQRAPAPLVAALALALAALGLAGPIEYARSAWAGFDRSRDRADERFLDETFRLAAPGATVLTDWYHATVLWYGQYGRGQRPDLTVEYVSPQGDEVPWLARAQAALGRGPVYATALDRRVGEQFHLQRLGDGLYAVLPEAATAVPEGLTASRVRFGDAIELLGYRLETPPGGADVALTLAWRADAPVGRDYSQFVHLADEGGHVWGQRDGAPGEGLYPTGRWRPGEVVVERYALTAAANAPQTEYALKVGFYESLPAGGWRRLEARDAAGAALGDAPTIARLPVRPLRLDPADPPATPNLVARLSGRVARALRGDGPRAGAPAWAARGDALAVPLGRRILLTGWAVDAAEARPGATLRVALDLRPLESIPEDAAAFVHLVDGGGRLRAQSDSVPVEGGLPTLRWAPGRPVRDTRRLRLPADLAPGTYQLRAGMYVMATGAHLPVLDDRLARAGQGDHVVLADLAVRP
jgi:hypothetical protein